MRQEQLLIRPNTGQGDAEASHEAVGVGVVSLNAEWRVVGVNAAAGARLALEPGKIGGGGLGTLFENGEAIEERLRQGIAEGGQGFAAEARLMTGNGGVVDIWARPSARPLNGDETIGGARGAVARDGGGVALTLVDASARVALQQEVARLRDQLGAAERAKEKATAVRRETSTAAVAPTMIGSSAGIRKALEQVERIASTSATTLIHGETGVGKDLIARALHAKSPRAAEAFIAVNCAALPETLMESELFGHERGAFTGADRQRQGKFELADEGTLFLDEIAELSLAAQAKLLRVLQNGQFERVGGSETISSDVRVVAATHRDLARQVERGRFREDLFYRLNVFRIEVPPLRDRREDIRPLVEFLHERHARRMGRALLPISDRSMRRSMAYRWPGNIRELENAVERATLLSDGAELEIELPEAPAPQGAAGPGGGAAGVGPGSGGGPQGARDVLLDLSSEQLQRMQVMHALETSSYRVFGENGAAKKIGVNPRTLLSRMDRLGIPRPRTMKRMRRGEDG